MRLAVGKMVIVENTPFLKQVSMWEPMVRFKSKEVQGNHEFNIRGVFINAFQVLIFLCLCVGFEHKAHAAVEDFQITLSEPQVSITTGFNGAKISVFGVKPAGYDVAVAVLGPKRSMIVRQKDKVLGMWLNKQSIRFREIPAYYDFAISKPESTLSTPDVLKSLQLGINSLQLRFSGKHDDEDVERFRAALVQNKQVQGYFPLEPRRFEFITDQFYRTTFFMPASLPTGDYAVKAFLFQDKVLVDTKSLDLKVAQVGASAAVHDFAYQDGFFYGLTCIFLALFAGTVAYVIARRD